MLGVERSKADIGGFAHVRDRDYRAPIEAADASQEGERPCRLAEG